MPKFPDYSERVKSIPNSVFESFKPQFRKLGSKLIPFHLGDTHMQPFFNLPVDDSFLEKYKNHNRYCNTFGVAGLRKVLAQKVNEDNDFNITSNNIMITNGAVNALNAAIFSIMNPGEEILVLTPCWPFFQGIVKMAEGIIKEVPFYFGLYDNYENSDFDIEEYLQKHISDKTVAIYLNTPNNPSGKVLTKEQLQTIARVVKKNKLWLISDEAYESFVYDGEKHYSIANFENIMPQTITVFSFAKMFMVAGYRLGYIAGCPEVLDMINKVLVHQIYSAPSILQYMMIEPVKTRHKWLPDLKKHYEETRNTAWNRLAVKTNKPQAGYFLFFSLKPYLENRTFDELFEEILNTGVALTPGVSFGKDFAGYARLCFTSVDEDKLIRGIDLINGVLNSNQ